MSNQLRFEGNDLESLLQRVRNEVGEEARIVAANRLRKGGVGGFFARELFEVIVEPDEAEIELIPAAKLGRGRKHKSTASESVSMLASSSTSQASAESALSAVAVGGGSAKNPPRRAATSVLDVMDQEDEMAVNTHRDFEIDLRADDRQASNEVSTQTERFAQILERLAIATERPETDDVLDELIVDDRMVGTAPTVGHATAPNDVRFDTYSRSSAAPRFDHSTELPATGGIHQAAHDTAARQAAPLPSTVRYEREVAASQAPEAVIDRDELIERPEGIFARFGLPARYIPRGVAGSAMRAALVESLERLPTFDPLPESRGVTVAIVGTGARPVALARILAAEQGIDPDTVVIATEQELGNGVPTWLQISDGPTAQERRRSWRRRDHVSFVAVSVASITAATQWTNMMLDHLEPTQVWGVANAGWKAEDVTAWAERLGGLDVLAIERLEETVSPASLLEVGVPIARLDGEPASATRWAEVLLDRVVVQ